MDKRTREEMDRLATEAFAEDGLEESLDLDFDPGAVVAGDEDAFTEYVRLRKTVKAFC